MVVAILSTFTLSYQLF